MKIRTRLKFNTFISLGVIALILLSLIWSFQAAQRADQNVLLTDKIQKAAFERIVLRDNWLLYRESRPAVQWYAKTEALGKLLDAASRQLADKENMVILQEMRKDFEITASSFSTIIEKHKGDKITKKDKLAFTEAETRFISQLFLKAYTLNDHIARLRDNTFAAALKARNRLIALSIVFLLCTFALIIGNSLITNNLMTKRLIALNKGIGIVGTGNLEYRMDDTGNDELTDLARKVNAMSENLKHSYTSLENLQKEIARRGDAEASTKKIALHQQVLLSAIPDIIMEVDVNKIYTWANKPGIVFFGKDVIGKSADFYFLREQNTFDIVQPIFKGSDDIIYVESWQKRQDGEERLLAWWCRVLKDVQGNVTGALSSARDITERRLATEEIKRLNEELEQRVLHRTKELAAKNKELERINRIFVDREMRMRELKARLSELEKKK